MERNPLIIVEHEQLTIEQKRFNEFENDYDDEIQKGYDLLKSHFQEKTCDIYIQGNEYAFNIIQTGVSSDNEAIQRVLNLLTISFTLDYGE